MLVSYWVFFRGEPCSPHQLIASPSRRQQPIQCRWSVFPSTLVIPHLHQISNALAVRFCLVRFFFTLSFPLPAGKKKKSPIRKHEKMGTNGNWVNHCRQTEFVGGKTKKKKKKSAGVFLSFSFLNIHYQCGEVWGSLIDNNLYQSTKPSGLCGLWWATLRGGLILWMRRLHCSLLPTSRERGVGLNWDLETAFSNHVCEKLFQFFFFTFRF